VAAPAALIPAQPRLRHRLRLAKLRGRGLEIHGTPIIGANVRITGPVVLNANASIGDATQIHGPVTVGEGAVLGERCRLIAHESITIGRNALLGDGVVLTDFEPGPLDPERPTRSQTLRTKPIAIGDGARIGHGTCLLPGARVKPGAAVAPNTVLK
jgi:acetyltransferase-like isoleucine patch superfamily enzyme